MPHQRYTVNGKRVPSVTTILGKFKDPGALMYWSWDTAYSVLAEVVDLLEMKPSRSRSSALLKFLKSKPLDRANYRKISTAAANSGTIAHDLVEQWIHATRGEKLNLGKITPKEISSIRNCPLDVAKQAHNAFLNFLEWSKVSKFRPQRTEVPLSSQKHLFGGCLDCIAVINKQRVLLDWKTSKSIYADYLCQLAAYGILWNENNPDKPVEGYHLIRFTKESADFHHHRFDDLSEAAELFLLLRRAYDLLKEIEKRAK